MTVAISISLGRAESLQYSRNDEDVENNVSRILARTFTLLPAVKRASFGNPDAHALDVISSKYSIRWKVTSGLDCPHVEGTAEWRLLERCAIVFVSGPIMVYLAYAITVSD